MSGISQARRFYFGSSSALPHTKSDSRAVAAAAELSDSKLPGPGATPGPGTLRCDHCAAAPNTYRAFECRCGNPKSGRHLVCHRCWCATPEDIRTQLKFGTVKNKRVALRTILDFAAGRKVLATL